MTATTEDIFGWDSVEVIQKNARRWAWCVRHRIPYGTFLTTAGIYAHCTRCDDEQMALLWHDPLPYWRLLKS